MTYYDGVDDEENLADAPYAEPVETAAEPRPEGLGWNDTPFEPLPSPPASASQPTADSLLRGNDYAGLTGDEYAMAVAYEQSITNRVLSKNNLMQMLSGSRTAYDQLQAKTLPLAESSPPHYDGP